MAHKMEHTFHSLVSNNHVIADFSQSVPVNIWHGQKFGGRGTFFSGSRCILCN